MATYVNTGYRFERGDGSWWERGEKNEPTPLELAMYGHKLVLADGEEADPPDPLAGVEFASPEAESLARESDMDASDFKGVLGSGTGHAFRVADVERLRNQEQ